MHLVRAFRPQMSIEWITVLMFGGMIVLLLAGLPLAFVTGLIAVGFAMPLFGVELAALISSRVYSFMSEYVLVSVPMFILMASIMERSGVAQRPLRRDAGLGRARCQAGSPSRPWLPPPSWAR